MKKIFKYAIFAFVVGAFASCAKDELLNIDDESNKSDQVITGAFISAETKTTISGVTPQWAAGDQIALYDASNHSASITLITTGSYSKTEGLITNNSFTFVKPDNLIGDVIFAVYPATAGAGVDAGQVKITIPSQTDGSFAKANICAATVDLSVSTSLRFKNATSIVKITDKSTSITTIKVTQTGICGTFPVDLSGNGNATLGEGTDIANSITCTGITSIPVYVAVAPVNASGKIASYFNSTDDNEVGSKSLTAAKQFTTNKIYNIGFANVYNSIGVFSISPTEKVSFSKGNMYYNGTAFCFETNQYDFPSSSSYDATHVSHFYWTNDQSEAIQYDQPSKTKVDAILFTNSSSFVIGGETGKWFALKGSTFNNIYHGWDWILGKSSYPNPGTYCRTSSTINGTANARYAKVKITVSEGKTVQGLLVFPDVFEWETTSMGTAPANINGTGSAWTTASVYSKEQFEAMENAGCVFLPSTGYRQGNSITSQENGYYWSSQYYDNRAFYEYFGGDKVSSVYQPNYRNDGHAIRLVHY